MVGACWTEETTDEDGMKAVYYLTLKEGDMHKVVQYLKGRIEEYFNDLAKQGQGQQRDNYEWKVEF